MRRDVITSLLDVLALLLVATGLAAAAWQYIGPLSLVVAGIFVAGGSQAIDAIGVKRGGP